MIRNYDGLSNENILLCMLLVMQAKPPGCINKDKIIFFFSEILKIKIKVQSKQLLVKLFTDSFENTQHTVARYM